MKLRLAALLLTACATASSGVRTVDKPTTQLPDGLTKCTGALEGPIADDAAPRCADDDTLCTQTQAIATECLATLKGEVTGAPYRGTLVFGLNADDSGNITGACFFGGTLGEAPKTLACLADQARAKRFNIVPEAVEQKWTVRYVVE